VNSPEYKENFEGLLSDAMLTLRHLPQTSVSKIEEAVRSHFEKPTSTTPTRRPLPPFSPIRVPPLQRSSSRTTQDERSDEVEQGLLEVDRQLGKCLTTLNTLSDRRGLRLPNIPALVKTLSSCKNLIRQTIS